MPSVDVSVVELVFLLLFGVLVGFCIGVSHVAEHLRSRRQQD